MGTGTSKSERSETMDNINMIAANYILKNRDMDLLLDQTYCNQLHVITKKAFDKNFTLSEVELMNKHGINAKEKIYSVSSDSWAKNQVDAVRKDEICSQLSTFYVKIAHIFAAIVDTIKPVPSSDGPSYKKLPRTSSKTFIDLPNDNFCLNRLNNLESVLNERNTADKTICKQIMGKDNKSVLKWKHEIGSKSLTELFEWEKDKNDLYENSIKLFRENLTGKNSSCSNRTKIYKENKGKTSGVASTIHYKDYCSTRLCDKLNENLQYTCIDKTQLGVKYKQHIEQMRKRYHKNLDKLYAFIIDIFELQADIWVIKASLTDAKLDVMIPKVRDTIAKCYFDCNNDYIKGLKIYTSVYEYYLIKKKTSPTDCERPIKGQPTPAPAPAPAPGPAPVPAPVTIVQPVIANQPDVTQTRPEPTNASDDYERRERERRERERRERERRHIGRDHHYREHDPRRSERDEQYRRRNQYPRRDRDQWQRDENYRQRDFERMYGRPYDPYNDEHNRNLANDRRITDRDDRDRLF